MKRNYEELIQSANKAMMEKLLENEHKPGFDDIRFHSTYRDICIEVSELSEEVGAYGRFRKRESQNIAEHIDLLKKMRREAADVSNHSAMIILECDRRISKLEANVSTVKTKLFKVGDVFNVECPRTGKTSPARDCIMCSKFIEIDPVKAEIKCRED